MAKDIDQLASGFENENTGGLMTGFLAEEDAFDRRSLWRIGSWGAGAVAAVVLAVLAGRSQIAVQREQFVAADLARQAQQIQSLAKESQSETRRLASAVDTLNGDRDRLFSRLTVLEQGLDAVTGSIERQSSAKAAQQAVPLPSVATQVQAATQSPVPPPVVAPVMTTVAAVADRSQTVVEATPAPAAPMAPAAASAATMAGGSAAQGATASTTPAATASTTPATTASAPPAAAASAPLVAEKSIMGPHDPAAAKLIEPAKAEKVEKIPEKPDRPDKPPKTVTGAPMPDVVAAAPPPVETIATEADEAQAAAPKIAIQRTEFGVDVGGANSIPGLRALWRGLLKSRANTALTTLHPIIVIRENTGGLGMQLRLVAGPLSDAAAAAKICASIENDRNCETTVFDGQRLAMKPDEPTGSISPRPVAGKPSMAKPDPAKPDTEKPDVANLEPVKPIVAKPVVHRRYTAKRVAKDEPAKKPDSPSALSSFFSRSK